jgi:hypothetical protein
MLMFRTVTLYGFVNRCHCFVERRASIFGGRLLKLKAVCSSETFVFTYKSTWPCCQEYQHKHIHSREGLRSHKMLQTLGCIEDKLSTESLGLFYEPWTVLLRLCVYSWFINELNTNVVLKWSRLLKPLCTNVPATLAQFPRPLLFRAPQRIGLVRSVKPGATMIKDEVPWNMGRGFVYATI